MQILEFDMANPRGRDMQQAPRRRVPHRSRDRIGAALVRLHETVTAEPLPQEFLRLIAEIDRKIEKRGKP